jgi:hypothetical protein
MDRAGLAIWGSGDDDVYVAGGPLGAAGMAMLRHFDGATWTEIGTGTRQTLWWVWGAPAATDVWMVGEEGTVLRYDGERVSEVASGTAAHLYGVWGSSSDDVWIVGGRPGPGGPDDVVLRWDGRTLSAVELPASRGAALFKVWGSAPGELWVAGEGGTLWRRSAGAWTDVSPELDTLETLTTVHGCAADDVYAVGGRSIYHFDGARWSRDGRGEILAVPTGVACSPETVLVVGSGGLKLRLDRAAGTWIDETFAAPYDTDFHGAWISPTGVLWATGGDYVTPASAVTRRTGVLARQGCAEAPSAARAP